MGTVWLAHPYDAPDQLYAVKTVSDRYASDPRVCAMFVKEASLAAAIDHPNVVRLYDVGIHEGVPFFVMEWIDGFSLRNVARAVTETGERVPPSIALRVASDLCSGLHAAHELRGDDGQPLGLVHRDVSPHNVLVSREGIAKLIDFGVAKAHSLATGSDASVCGGLKGKVRYMAPEQALERGVDRRADLFSVGAVLYQLLTGRAPFEGPNELAIINALLSTQPVFIPDTLPEPVQWILRRALGRRPEQRFSDAAEMQDAIEMALTDLGQPDSHADVARCLAWFDRPPSEDDERAPVAPASPPRLELRPDHDTTLPLRGPTTSPTPPLAYSLGPRASVPPRQPSLVDDDEVAIRRRHPSSASSFRFVLLAAAFVGVLGTGAALLVRDAPKARRAASSHDVAASLDDAPPPTTSTFSPGGVPTNTPIIDMGDLDDPRAPSPWSPRPRPARRATAAPPVASPPPNPFGAVPATSGKPPDMAGPIKVWK